MPETSPIKQPAMFVIRTAAGFWTYASLIFDLRKDPLIAKLIRSSCVCTEQNGICSSVQHAYVATSWSNNPRALLK